MSKWINIEDRLPESHIEVLTWPQRENSYGSEISGYYDASKSCFFVDCEDSYFCYELPIEVTHWMPLPEPPKESEDET